MSSPLCRSERFTLQFVADLLIPTTTRLLWEEFSHAVVAARRHIHSKFHQCTWPGTHSYNWVNWGVVVRTKTSTLRNGSKWDLNPCSLDCAYIVLPPRDGDPRSPIYIARIKMKNIHFVSMFIRRKYMIARILNLLQLVAVLSDRGQHQIVSR